jgi:hypothetical protein
MTYWCFFMMCKVKFGEQSAHAPSSKASFLHNTKFTDARGHDSTALLYPRKKQSVEQRHVSST